MFPPGALPGASETDIRPLSRHLIFDWKWWLIRYRTVAKDCQFLDNVGCCISATRAAPLADHRAPWENVGTHEPSSIETMTPPAQLPISVYIIARNEADRIGRTIAAVADLAAEIIVVDSGSTDATVSTAEEHGARVLFSEWPGYGPQKRFAETACAGPWLLNIDADEVVSPDLAVEIRALFTDGEPPCGAYEVPIAEVFPGEAAPHRWAYALYPVRLYRKNAGRYSESIVHDRVALEPGVRVGRLRHTIHHFSVRSLGEQLAKFNAYSYLQVEDLARRNRVMPQWRILVEFPFAFIKTYFGRRHFLRGWYGIATAANAAFGRHLRVAKAIERQRQRSVDKRSTL